MSTTNIINNIGKNPINPGKELFSLTSIVFDFSKITAMQTDKTIRMLIFFPRDKNYLHP